MEKITRFGVSIEPDLLKKFDNLLQKKGYKNRSEAIRDLIRNTLIDEQQTHPDKNMVGTLTIVYNHHDHDVQHTITHIQHHTPHLIRSTMHTHLDQDNCLEVLVIEGKTKHMKKLADNIIATKGVKHGKLVITQG